MVEAGIFAGIFAGGGTGMFRQAGRTEGRGRWKGNNPMPPLHFLLCLVTLVSGGDGRPITAHTQLRTYTRSFLV